MNVSAEITLMPLNDNYKKIIKNFIQSIRNTSFKVLENPLSTQIYGDFQPIMEMLTKKINIIFSESDGIIINLKIVKGNRINYKPDF
jgi:uncharacterized protein YqgV (UPF0045/DUF77 family)